MNPKLTRLLIALSVLGLFAIIASFAWNFASRKSSNRPTAGSQLIQGSPEPSAAPAKVHPLAHLENKNPVDHFKAAKSKEERLQAISEFMALGDDNNYAMLRAALDDPDPEVRLFATESASALEVEQAAEVWKKGAVSTDPDVREMTWSLSITYPMEQRAAIYREALAFGPPSAMTEAIEEMGVTPERPLFEMMLTIGSVLPQDRVPTIMATIQEWLEPGGGDIPSFKSLSEALQWWEAQHENYDEYLLRTDL